MTTTRRRLLAQGLCLPLLLSPADPARAAPARPRRLWGGLRSPVGMAYDAQGALFIAEWSAGRVRKFTPNGQATTFAEGLSGPSGLAIAPDGTIYVASYSDDLIWRFTPEGTKEVHTRGLATPAGLSFDRAGRLMVANRRTNQILRIEGDRKTAIISDLNTPVGVVQTTDGGYVVSNIAGGVTVLRPDGQRIEAGQDFATPGPGVAMTNAGRVFVVDYGGTMVREIAPDGRASVVADGLSSPVGLVVSPDQGALLTATWGDSAVFHIPLV